MTSQWVMMLLGLAIFCNITMGNDVLWTCEISLHKTNSHDLHRVITYLFLLYSLSDSYYQMFLIWNKIITFNSDNRVLNV